MTGAPSLLNGFAELDPAWARGCRALLRPGADLGAPVVVFVHGTLDRASSFNRIARRLPGLNLVTYDRRGYQGSRSLGPAGGLDDHIADLRCIIEHVSQDRPVLLFGHSFGGDIAIATALQDRSAIDGIVVFEPPMPWLETTARPTAPISLDAARGGEAEAFFRRVVSDEAWEKLPPREKADRRADSPAVASDFSIIRHTVPFTLDALAGLSVPLSIGLGAATSMPHHATSATRVASAAPQCAVISVDGAGHGAHLSHPDGVAQMIAAAASREHREEQCASS
jgi:pimeloyl-ACP methyl ester carboxylesterase